MPLSNGTYGPWLGKASFFERVLCPCGCIPCGQGLCKKYANCSQCGEKATVKPDNFDTYYIKETDTQVTTANYVCKNRHITTITTNRNI